MAPSTASFADLQVPELWGAIQADPRITSAVIYLDGWVPNSYRYPAPGRCVRMTRREPERPYPNALYTIGGWDAVEGTYDRKRSHGRGPHWVAFSDDGGRLASGR